MTSQEINPSLIAKVVNTWLGDVAPGDGDIADERCVLDAGMLWRSIQPHPGHGWLEGNFNGYFGLYLQK